MVIDDVLVFTAELQGMRRLANLAASASLLLDMSTPGTSTTSTISGSAEIHVVLVSGIQGTGKTTLARAVARRLGACVVVSAIAELLGQRS